MINKNNEERGKIYEEKEEVKEEKKTSTKKVYYGKEIEMFNKSDLLEIKTEQDGETICGDGLDIFVVRGDSSAYNYPYDAKKLFYLALCEFTKKNNKKSLTLDTRICININDFLHSCGKSVDNDSAKKYRNRIRKDCKILQHTFFKIKSEIDNTYEGEMVMFQDHYYSTNKKVIVLNFGEKFAKYIVNKMQLTIFHPGLLLIDGNHKSAYNIGHKLNEHYNITSNKKTGSYNKLSVNSLLKQMIKFDSKNIRWRRDCRDRLEENLDYLVGIVITDWHYLIDGKQVDKEKIHNIDMFEKYAKCMIEFEIIKFS